MSRNNLNPMNPRTRKRVAIVLSNPAVSTTTGWPVGFWWSELTHSYFRFAEIGYEVDIYSPVGGRCGTDAMIDPDDASRWQAEDVISRGFKHDPGFMRLVEYTAKVDDIDAGRYDALRGRRPRSDIHLREGRELQAKFSGVLRDRQADRRALPRRGHSVLIANAEEGFSDQALWDMGALPKRRARDHMADRGRAQKARRQPRPGRPLEGIRDPRRQPHHRSAELKRRRDRRGGDCRGGWALIQG
jgi:hypothetical protein